MNYRTHALICAGAACLSSGADDVQDVLQSTIAEEGLDAEVKVVRTGCVGSCDLAPILIIEPDSVFYQSVKPKDAEIIVREHLLKGRIYEKCLIRDPDTRNLITTHADFSFFRKQLKIVLGNCGIIDPENINEYIARDGYQALGKALSEMTPDGVIEEIETSRIRGRGGAGFPAGRKWRFVKDAEGPVKYVVCNADEGDPGAFMDRSVLEGDPHRVLEAMAIAGYAVGASKGYLYIRAEYPLAIRRVEMAIRQARELGLLGDNVLETGFSFDLEIRVGAGAFVCGEETALLASILGKRGMPRPRPPFPAVSGLRGCPTLINNVETYANIVPIIAKGGAWFSGIGTERSTGTKVFALAGKINNTGLVEVPMGMTLREIIYDIGGGIPGGKKFKAAQTGGPSGGCIPEQHLDIPMEYDTLFEIGSMMGSGGLIVMDEDSCMVDVSKFFLEFCLDESCGKCPPCRVGTRQMHRILEKFTRGESGLEDLDKLDEMSSMIQRMSLCGLGQTAPNPVLSTVRYFRDEYVAHAQDKRCPAHVCGALVKYDIDEEQCTGCGLCSKVCPVTAITKVDDKKLYAIEQTLCTRCGACVDVCRVDAVTKESVGIPVEEQESWLSRV